MDDISEHVHEKNDEHTAIHGPRRALRAPQTMIWRVETLSYLIHICAKSLSALDLIFADFPHRIQKIEIGVLRGSRAGAEIKCVFELLRLWVHWDPIKVHNSESLQKKPSIPANFGK